MNDMRLKLLYITFLVLLPLLGYSQAAEFHLGSNQFIHAKMQEAKSTVDNALKRYPNDAKLKALREQIKEEEKKKQEQEKKDQQQKQEQEKKEKQEQEQKEQEQKEKEQQDKEQKEKEEQEKK